MPVLFCLRLSTICDQEVAFAGNISQARYNQDALALILLISMTEDSRPGDVSHDLCTATQGARGLFFSAQLDMLATELSIGYVVGKG